MRFPVARTHDELGQHAAEVSSRTGDGPLHVVVEQKEDFRLVVGDRHLSRHWKTPFISAMVGGLSSTNRSTDARTRSSLI
ncbi:hypothetical protein [Rhizobium leguminosarum]|uniref:hypothetical protein n=1 Tax=Rhizobium leguminosarum TaxID=384 RepID=UPI00352788CA